MRRFIILSVSLANSMDILAYIQLLSKIIFDNNKFKNFI
jgi:hypothetical protein